MRQTTSRSKPSQVKLYLLSDMVVFAEDGVFLDRVRATCHRLASGDDSDGSADEKRSKSDDSED